MLNVMRRTRSNVIQAIEKKSLIKKKSLQLETNLYITWLSNITK